MTLKKDLSLFYVYECFSCMHVCMCTMCVFGAQSVEKDTGFPRAVVTDSYEPQCGCWELNPISLENTACALNL